MAAFEITVIFVSQHVNSKINQVHHVTADEVAEACDAPEAARLSEDETGVERLLLVGTTDTGRKIKVCLYPTDVEGEWNLASAFPVQ